MVCQFLKIGQRKGAFNIDADRMVPGDSDGAQVSGVGNIEMKSAREAGGQQWFAARQLRKGQFIGRQCQIMGQDVPQGTVDRHKQPGISEGVKPVRSFLFLPGKNTVQLLEIVSIYLIQV